MNKYKILWIDDQYELLSELMERCEVINGFEITKCRFAKEGMKTYEKHLRATLKNGLPLFLMQKFLWNLLMRCQI